MMNYKNLFLLLTVLTFSALNGYSQVEINKQTTKEKKKKEKKEKEAREKDNTTSVFAIANWSFTTRKLVSNDGLHGDTLGERANEVGRGAWSFGIGFRNQVHKNIAWEGGISFMQNGEQYSFEGVDSSYTSQTKYMYIAMPLKLYYTYGESFKVFAGGGLVPQMYIGYRQNTEYTNSINETVKEENKIFNEYNPFVLSAVVNVGAQVELGGNWSLLVVPEYKIQLTSSYAKDHSFKHYGRSLGFNFGLILDL